VQEKTGYQLVWFEVGSSEIMEHPPISEIKWLCDEQLRQVHQHVDDDQVQYRRGIGWHGWSEFDLHIGIL